MLTATDRLIAPTRKLLLVLLGACVVVMTGLRVPLITSHSPDIAGAELSVMHGIQKIMLGKALYTDPQQQPFDVVQYTPAYHALVAGTARALGIGAYELRALYLLNRILSLVLNLLTLAVVFAAARAAGANRSGAVIAGLLTFAAFSKHFFGRVDALYALGFVATLFFVFRYARAEASRQKRDAMLLAGAMAAVALLFKQTAILLFMLVPLLLLWLRDWRALAWFSGAAGLTLLVVGSALLQGEDMSLLLANTVGGLRNGLRNDYLRHLFASRDYLHLVGWHAASLLIPVALLKRRDPLSRFLLLSIPLSLAFAFLTALKAGSEYNYFFENLVLVFVGCAVMSAEPKLLNTSRTMASALVLIFFLQAGQYMVHRASALRYTVLALGDDAKHEARLQSDERLHSVLKDEFGLLPMDHVFITYRGHLELLLNGQSLVSQKDIVEWSVDPPFDLGRFDAMMRSGEVRYVISDRPLDSLRFLQWAYPLGAPVSAVDGRWIYRPAR
ncbi:MAG: hypothetical protein IPM46_04610 [Flavobacteriales bacterium]|nr:hypothetical protein [Flavobacteriales bacterium]